MRRAMKIPLVRKLHMVSQKPTGVVGRRRPLSSITGGVDQLEEIHDVVIVGSGPAGYTAALYAGRAAMNPVVLAGYQHGGQLMLTSDVENFPGYPMAIGGPELMEDLRVQAERFGAKILYRDALKLDTSSWPFRIQMRKGEVVAKSVIVSTGAEAAWLGAEGEDEVKGKGVSTCATCDGAFCKGQEVVVIGGGDSAMEEALFLTKFASKVTVLHRRDVFRASRIMLERARAHPKVELQTFRKVVRWFCDKHGLAGAESVDPRDGSTHFVPCRGAFIAIGHKPMTAFLGPSGVELDEDGYIVHKEHTMTSVPGIFAAGDVVDKRYRQAITAAGQGCQAAIDCERWLAHREAPPATRAPQVPAVPP